MLVGFPFVEAGQARRKRRPAVVVQADRYNRKRAVTILAPITGKARARPLPCKVDVARASPAGRSAGLRTDSVVDCQTLVTIPRDEIEKVIGAFPASFLEKIDAALRDALGIRPCTG